MKVLHINLNYHVSSLYKQFADHLILNKCNISVYFPTISNYQVKNKPSYLITSPILNKYDRLFFLKRNKKIVRDIERRYDLKKKSIDILHAHSLFSNGFVAYTLKKKFNIPYVVAVRNTDINVFFKKLVYMRKKGIEILNEAEKIIFLSEPYKEMLLEKYIPKGIKENIEMKSEVIPNGINPFWLQNINEPKLRPSDKKLKIISVGVINRNKNALLTAKACQSLINKLSYKVEFKLIGKVQDQKYFNSITNFDFVKHIPVLKKEELICEYRDSDIFVMPSIKETFGLVYAEAMSQGLPIIYSKDQGFDKQFNEGIVGYHVNSRDVGDIVNKVLLILEEYEYLSGNCVNFADRYSWNEISRTYIKIYEDVIEKG